MMSARSLADSSCIYRPGEDSDAGRMLASLYGGVKHRDEMQATT
jgi:hypothetical protein